MPAPHLRGTRPPTPVERHIDGLLLRLGELGYVEQFKRDGAYICRLTDTGVARCHSLGFPGVLPVSIRVLEALAGGDRGD